MAYFALKLLPPRPGFPMDMRENERRAMDAHSTYWRERAADGAVLAIGPVMDMRAPFGFGFVIAADLGGAMALGDDDPVIKAGLGFAYEVYAVPSLILGK